MKEKTLNHVREVCGLKELKFGCDVWVDDIEDNGHYSIWTYIGKTDYSGDFPIWKCKYSTFATSVWSRFAIEKKPHEIIGLEPQLNHLLSVLPKSEDTIKESKGLLVINTDGYFCYEYPNKSRRVVKYDLTKSVSENLDNPEVCKLLAELLNLK